MPSDVYTWAAIYDNGSFLREFNSLDEEPHGFGEVDIARVKRIELLPTVDGIPAFAVDINQDQGQRPIFFRRRSIEIDPSGQEVGRLTLHVIGWQQTVNGKNVASYTFIYPDGSALVSSDHGAL